MLLATALSFSVIIQDVLNRRLLFFKTNRQQTSETITHHFFVSELSRRKLSMQPKFVAAQKNVVKTETQQKTEQDCSVLLLYLYSAGSACIAQYHELPTIGNLFTICSLYFSVPSCFCIDQPSEGEIIPFKGVCQSGRLHYPRRGGGFTHWLTDCFDVQPTTTSGNIITQRIFSALASANSFVYFASAQQHHADASACQ